MNRNTKLILLVSLFALVCLAILWGRWFPDNRQQELDQEGVGYSDIGNPMDAHAPQEVHLTDADGVDPLRLWIGEPPGAGHPAGGTPAAGSTAPIARPPANGHHGGTSHTPTPIGGERDLPPGWRKYTIQEDDRLWVIATRFLGAGHRYKEILRANPDLREDALRPNRVILIPPREGEAGAAPPNVDLGNRSASSPGRQPAPPPAGNRSYTVQSGDNLSRIAKNELGKSSRWQEIADLNGLSGDSVLRIGQELKLPSR